MVEALAEKAVRAFAKGLVEGALETGLPILLRKALPFWRKAPRIFVLFSLLLEYFELPEIEDVVRILEFCLNNFRKDARHICYDDVVFEYVMSHEVEEGVVPPDLDEYEEDVEFGTPSHVSLSGIRLYPQLMGEVTEIEGKRVILAAYKLMDAIVHKVNISTEAADLLRIKSMTKLMGVTSDTDFISKMHKELRQTFAEDEVSISPHMNLIEYKDGKSQMSVSLEDSFVLKTVLRKLGM